MITYKAMPFDQTPQRAHSVHVGPGRKVICYYLHMKIGAKEVLPYCWEEGFCMGCLRKPAELLYN